MLSESKVRSEELLRAGVQLLIVSAFTAFLLAAADSSTITGTWKADLSKTSPPDNRESAVTLTIREIGLRTYTIRLDRQTTDGGVVSEETTITCDGKSRPASEADSGAKDVTVFCGRTYPTIISIRVSQNHKTLTERVFRASPHGNSLNYTKTVDGHDQTYVFGRQ
jgi:hypothetical protein